MKKTSFLLLMLMLVFGAVSMKAETAYAFFSSDFSRLTFYYDNNYDIRAEGRKYELPTGYTDPGWLEHSSTVKTVYFDSSFANASPTMCYKWFKGMKQLTAIYNIYNLNTRNVGSFGWMFYQCESLKDLDLSRFVFKDNTVLTTNMLSFMNSLEVLYLPATAHFMRAGSCEGTGTIDNPCIMVYPITFRPQPTEVYDGKGCWKWKDGIFKDSQKPYALLSTDRKTLSFHDDDSLAVRTSIPFDIYLNNDVDKISTAPGWSSYGANTTVTTVTFHPSFSRCRPITCYKWFDSFSKLKTITGFSNLRTSGVKNMNYMFHGCVQLTDLDLTTFKTENVDSMTEMFSDCYRLRNLNLSSFYFYPNGHDYTKILSNLYSLKTFSAPPTYNNIGRSDNQALKGLAGFHKTYNPQSDRCLFVKPSPDFTPTMQQATNIGGEIAAFTSYGGLFKYPPTPYAQLSADKTTLTFFCDMERGNREGTTYDLPTNSSVGWSSSRSTVTKVVFDESFAAARPTICSNWFSYMSNLVEIEGIQYLNTSEVTAASGMFFMCSKLETLDVSHFDTSKMQSMAQMFYGCGKVTTLDVSQFDTNSVTALFSMFGGCRSVTSLDVSNFNTSKASDLSSMFEDCSKVTTLDVSKFNTAKVERMSDMFGGCSALTSIDVSKFDTSKVTDYTSMFEGCSSLTTLDLNNFKFDASDATNRIIRGCSQLSTLIVPLGASNWNKGVDADGVADHNEAACEYVGTQEAPCFLDYPSGFVLDKQESGTSWFKWKWGYFTDAQTPQPYAVLSDGVLTFYYDDQKDSRAGKVYNLNEGENKPEWFEDRASVTQVVFNPSFRSARPTSCYYWFANMENLESITMHNPSISEPDNLLYFCFNTSEVTNMRFMFAGCTKLTTLPNVFRMNTSKVTDMVGMFQNCSGLTTLNLGDHSYMSESGRIRVRTNFKTTNVTTMQQMFYGCTNLKTLTLTPVTTPNVTSMRAMFAGCESLTTLNISSFNTSKVAYMEWMFAECRSLTSLDLSKFDTSSVIYLNGMFEYCDHLQSVNLSSFNTSAVRDFTMMFEECISLTSLDLSNFTFNVDNVQYLLCGCTSLKGLSLPMTADAFYTDCCGGVGKPESPCRLYYPEGFNLVSEAEGEGWVQWKNGYFILPEVMPYAALQNNNLIFYYDREMNNLASSGVKVYRLNEGTTVPEWLEERASITKVIFTPSFSQARPTSCFKWFYNMGQATSIEGIENLNTSEVTHFELMFSLSGFTSLDLSHFDTSKATSMLAMFQKCTQLVEVNLTGFDTSNVTTFENFFSQCTNLETITGHEGLNTSKAQSMKQMFALCENLKQIDVSHYDTSSLEITSFMFYNCSSLTSLDLSHFNLNLPEEGYSTCMLQGCTSLQELAIPASSAGIQAQACGGIGTVESPCQLICPAGFTPTPDAPTTDEPVTSGDNWLKWKGGYFTVISSILKGDVNLDGAVSIADVMMTISYITSGNNQGFHSENADMNNDRSIDISDVMMIVSILIGN